jgi:hypothetical protein
MRKATAEIALAGNLLPRFCGKALLWPFLLLFLLSGPVQARSEEAENQALPDAPQAQTGGTAQAAVSPAPCKAAGTGEAKTPPCLPPPPRKWFERFLTGPEVKPHTPFDKAHQALHNVLDPFNALTILADDGISVGANPHSPYGPGLKGYAKSVGVSYTQDLTGEFFCTFLLPALTRQDPHYHRMPHASILRRAVHSAEQIVWTLGDDGKPMINYGDLVGGAAALAISNLYVPGQQTNVPSTVQRYFTGLATAPIDNLVSEFLPDVARHIHVQVVVFQRIINKVAQSGGPNQ